MSLTSNVTRGVTRAVTRAITDPGGWGANPIVPALWYDFASNVSLVATTGPTLSLTRATTASVTDYNNIIKTVASGEERYTGGRRVENLCIESEQFDDWVANGADTIVTADQTTSPTGTLTADKIADDGLGGTQFVGAAQSIVAGWPLASTATISCYMKADGLDWGYLDVSGMSGKTVNAYFDLTNGVVGASTGADNASEGIEDVGSGWYRCWISFSTSATDNSANFRVFAADGNGDITVDADGTSSIFVWGGQIEDVSGQDDPAPSEYQATTTAAVSKWYATKRRTNLAIDTTFQTDIGGNDWALISGAGAANSVANPVNGNVDAYKFGGNASDTSLRLAQTTASIPTYSELTVSFYAKSSNGITWVYFATSGLSAINSCYWNLGTGAVGTDANGTGAIEDVGDGWYRCSLTFTTGADGAGSWSIYGAEGNGDISFASAPAAADFIYVSNLQLEKGSSPTAYIATTTTVASSAVDTDITVTGLLVEEARTNVTTYSQDFGTTWAPGTDDVINTDQAIAPDGTLTADQLIDDAGGGTAQIAVSRTQSSIATSVPNTFSVYAKADGLDWLYINLTGVASLAITAYYDLTDGAVGATVGADVDATGIEDVGNGWYRCWLSFTGDAADTTGTLILYVAEANGDFTVDRDGTSSIFLWGAQLEAGAFPTSYIPTVAASVTRNKDIVDSSDVSWYSADAPGSVYVDVERSYTVGQANVRPFDLDNKLYWVAVSDTGYWRHTSGGLLIDSTGIISTVGVRDRIAFGFDTNDAATYINGTLGGTDSTGALPSTATQFHVGSRTNGTGLLNGHIAEIKYYAQRLTDKQLEDLSNGIDP